MEMNTSAARELALQLGIGYAGKYFNFGVGGTGTATQGSVMTSNVGLRYRQSQQFNSAAAAVAPPTLNQGLVTPRVLLLTSSLAVRSTVLVVLFSLYHS